MLVLKPDGSAWQTECCAECQEKYRRENAREQARRERLRHSLSTGKQERQRQPCAELERALREEQAQRRNRMDGDKKLVFGVIGLVCVTILVAILFIALWAYKEALAITLLALLVAFVGVYLWRQVNEQHLRHVRYKHKEEMPLSAYYPPYTQWTQTTGPYYPVQPHQYYYSPPAAYSNPRQRNEVKDE